MARDDEMMTPEDNASDELVPTWTTDGHLDEGTIHAWLDGAFDDMQSARVSAHVDGCAQCRESVAEARGFIAGASRMVHALDAVPSNVVPAADVERVAARIVAAAVADLTRTAVAPTRARRAWYTQPAMRAAAAILVMVAGGTYVWSRTSSTPTSASRVALERSVATEAPLSDSPKPVAASEPSSRTAPPAYVKPQPVTKEARADAASSTLAVAAPDSTRVIASQSIADRSRAVGAVVSERRAFAADAVAPASPPPAPTRAMGDGGARLISGQVTTTSGAPAAGVLLTATGNAKASTVTDSAGAYRLRVGGDSVVLLARGLGYDPTSRVVDLRNRDSARVDLKMGASVLQLSEVTIAGERVSVAGKVPNVPAPTVAMPAVSVTMGGLVQANMVERPPDERAARGRCWSMRVSGTPSLRLPTHVLGPSLADSGAIWTRWINWPSKGQFTSVEMARVGQGALTGSGVIGQDTVVLTLTPRGNDWTGLAVRRDSVSRLEQPIELRRASDGVCKW